MNALWHGKVGLAYTVSSILFGKITKYSIQNPPGKLLPVIYGLLGEGLLQALRSLTNEQCVNVSPLRPEPRTSHSFYTTA